MMTSAVATTPRPAYPYPHPTLTKIKGRPTLYSVLTLKKQLYANARVVPCILGGGAQGHLGYIMPAADYAAIQGTQVWADPDHPGALPQAAQGDTQVQMTNAQNQYRQQVETYQTFAQVKSDLTAQLLAACPSIYYASLEDADLGWANVNPRQILEALVRDYGTVKQSEIEKNRTRLSEPYNIDEPIENLWSHIKSIRDFAAAANEEISDAVTIRMTTDMLKKLGCFEHAIDKWKDKPNAERTWNNFQMHFGEENKRRLEGLTSKQAGYTPQQANLASDKPQTDSLASAKAEAWQNGFDTCKAAVAASKSSTPTSTTASSVSSSSKSFDDALRSPEGGTCQCVTAGGKKMYYCWSHGLGTNAKHTSATCNNPKENHKKEATLDNMMGSETTIMTRRKKQA